jgi:hypothetical protein
MARAPGLAYTRIGLAPPTTAVRAAAAE